MAFKWNPEREEDWPEGSSLYITHCRSMDNILFEGIDTLC